MSRRTGYIEHHISQFIFIFNIIIDFLILYWPFQQRRYLISKHFLFFLIPTSLLTFNFLETKLFDQKNSKNAKLYPNATHLVVFGSDSSSAASYDLPDGPILTSRILAGLIGSQHRLSDDLDQCTT